MGKKKARKPKKPTHRISEAEMDERVRFATQLILEGRMTCDITRFLSKHYGVTERMVFHYLSEARLRLRQGIDEETADLVAKHYAMYMEVIRDPRSSPRDKIHAISEVNKLLGLNKPNKHALTDPTGERPAQVDVGVTVTFEEEDLTDVEVNALASLSRAKRKKKKHGGSTTSTKDDE